MIKQLKYWIYRLLFSHKLGELIDSPLNATNIIVKERIPITREDWAFTTENDLLLEIGGEENPFADVENTWLDDGSAGDKGMETLDYIEAKRKERGIHIPVKKEPTLKRKAKELTVLEQDYNTIELATGERYLIPKVFMDEVMDMINPRLPEEVKKRNESIFIKVYRNYLVESETF